MLSLLGLGCPCGLRLLLKYSFLWKASFGSTVIPNQSPMEGLPGGGRIPRVSAGRGVGLRICLVDKFLILLLAAGLGVTPLEPLLWCCVIRFNKMYKWGPLYFPRSSKTL